MSWAGRRQTTKPEDLAYSLMGLFGVNMPLIYGEGEKAFQRLQLEIIKETNDQTIFSWTGDGHPSGILAHSPADFVPAEDSSRILGNLQNPAFSLTNRGLRIELPLAETPIRNVYVAVLNCFPAHSAAFNRLSLAIFLYRRFEGQTDFVRIHNEQLIGHPTVLPETRVHAPAKSSRENRSLHPWGQVGPFSHAPMDDLSAEGLPMPKHQRRQHPSDSAVLGGDTVAEHFSSTRQLLGLPPSITVRMDDNLGSAVFLFRNGAQQRFAVCLTLWGPDTKFGIVAGVEGDDMREIADEFLFGDWDQTVKRPGDHTLHAPFPDSSSAANTMASVTLGSLEYDASASAFVCEVSVSVYGGSSEFWLETTGPGVWPGWWNRYMDRLTGADDMAEASTPGRLPIF